MPLTFEATMVLAQGPKLPGHGVHAQLKRKEVFRSSKPEEFRARHFLGKVPCTAVGAQGWRAESESFRIWHPGCRETSHVTA